MKVYYCELCNFKTKYRNEIQTHHIVPRELNGSNDKWNLVYLCPNCHHLIFVPNSKSGHHSIRTPNSIIIVCKYLSTDGPILSYINMNGLELYTKLKN
jgi:hypothetical protein